jgi:SnoaL-like domain
MMLTTDTLKSRATAITIPGISQPKIDRYFATLNAGDYEATARLFAAEGTLHPPFEEPILGRKAIAAYLKAEAQGIVSRPQQGVVQTLPHETIARVTGQVQTPLFSVNVSWSFALNANAEILSVAIELLASPLELLNFQQLM